MESTSLDDIRLLHGMIDDHQNELLQERTRLGALRIELAHRSQNAGRMREAGLAEQAATETQAVQTLNEQIAATERRIARIEELVTILRRRRSAL